MRYFIFRARYQNWICLWRFGLRLKLETHFLPIFPEPKVTSANSLSDPVLQELMDYLLSVELIGNCFDKWLIGVIPFQKKKKLVKTLWFQPLEWEFVLFPPQRQETEYLWVVDKTRHFGYVVSGFGRHWSTCLTIFWHFTDQTTNHGIRKLIDSENNHWLQTMSS